MRIGIMLRDSEQAAQLALKLESNHEDWSCPGGSDPLTYDALILDDPLLADRLYSRAGAAPPFLLLFRCTDPRADACVNEEQELAPCLESLSFRLPRRYAWPQGEAKARGFLSALGMPRHLKGFDCLSWLIAAVLGNPALLNAVTLALYPQAGQALGLSPWSVERCVRHAIEHLWSHGDLDVLEAYFGQSVDPERGKPTNREFLAMAREHCRF